MENNVKLLMVLLQLMLLLMVNVKINIFFTKFLSLSVSNRRKVIYNSSFAFILPLSWIYQELDPRVSHFALLIMQIFFKKKSRHQCQDLLNVLTKACAYMKSEYYFLDKLSQPQSLIFQLKCFHFLYFDKAFKRKLLQIYYFSIY